MIIPASSTLTGLVAAAVAPVALVTAAAILLSGYTGKYSTISAQTRELATEHRRADITEQRRGSIIRQIGLFRRRITAMWAASVFLSLALLCFVGTILSLVFTRLGLFGGISLVLGLVMIALAIVAELYEIRLAQFTMREELADML